MLEQMLLEKWYHIFQFWALICTQVCVTFKNVSNTAPEWSFHRAYGWGELIWKTIVDNTNHATLVHFTTLPPVEVHFTGLAYSHPPCFSIATLLHPVHFTTLPPTNSTSPPYLPIQPPCAPEFTSPDPTYSGNTCKFRWVIFMNSTVNYSTLTCG